MGRVRAYVGLGANLGDAAGTLAAAVHALAALAGVRPVGVSRLYATAPVGVTDQPEVRSAVVALDVLAGADLRDRSPGPPHRAQGAGACVWAPRWPALGSARPGPGSARVRTPRDPSGAPPGGLASDDPTRAAVQWLTVPHASARERLFVLAPLADLAPGLRPPGWGETVAAARRRAELREGPAAVRPIGEWDAGEGTWTVDRAG